MFVVSGEGSQHPRVLVADKTTIDPQIIHMNRSLGHTTYRRGYRLQNGIYKKVNYP